MWADCTLKSRYPFIKKEWRNPRGLKKEDQEADEWHKALLQSKMKTTSAMHQRR